MPPGKAAITDKVVEEHGLSTAEYQKITDQAIKDALAKGVKKDTGSMEAYADLKPEQVDMLVNYVRWVGKKK